MNRFLIGCIAIETKNARLNGSHRDVEENSSSIENVSYTKKIKSRNGIYPYASGQYVKKNIKENARNRGQVLSQVKSIDTTQAVSEGHPFKNYDEDVMGFMNATKLVLSEEEYLKLDEGEKIGFSKKSKNKKTVYEKNITKKRRARLMVSPLQAISSTKIQQEFATRTTDKTNTLYSKEVYSNIMSMGFNLDIGRVGIFTVSEDSSGFRDYAPEEVEALGLNVNNEGIIELDKEDKFKRIEDTLRSIEYFNTKIAQNNNLEDLNTKFVIMAEYTIGNNIFNNIFRYGTLDIDYLIEAIEENEEFRKSKIYVGVRKGFMQKNGEDLRDYLEKILVGDKYFIGTVKDAFDKYLQELNI